MFALALVAAVTHATPAPSAPSDLPDDVVAPTPTEAIGIDEIYAVRAGKIWVRHKGQAWALFDGTGTVTGSSRAVVGVFTDELDHALAVTDDGAMHHHEKGAWDTQWGLPTLPFTRGPLALPFATSKLRAGRVAYSMRKEHVLYYEDRNGAQFNWGYDGTTSVFMLDDSGRRIVFADPWIPPDVSREICAPDRMSLIMQSIAASASMLFVEGIDGSLWTRFEDYDHDGGTPLFSYEYRADRSTKPPPAGKPGTDPLSAAQTRGLPGDDWHRQPAIALEGKARLTRRIAIVQTGQGNHARELRVIGKNADGVVGVYVKTLDAPSWTFRAFASGPIATTVPLAPQIGDDEWLDPNVTSKDAHGVSPSISYAGWLKPLADHTPLGNVYAKTDDFWFHCSPFHMTIDIDGVEVGLLVHAVDAWTFFTENDPVDDDTATKRLKLTLSLDAHDPRNRALSERTLGILNDIFKGDLDKAFAFVGIANQHELVIVPTSYPWNLARTRWQLVLRHNPAERARANTTLRPASNLARTLVDVDAASSPATCASSPKLRADAANALAKVTALRAQAEQRLALSMAVEAALPGGTGLIDVATGVSTTRFWLPVLGWMDSLEQHVPAVLGAPVLAYRRFIDASRADFDRVERTLSACAQARASEPKR